MRTPFDRCGPTAEEAPYLVIDLDGTLVRGATVAPGANELIGQVEDRYMVVSNNSTHSASDLAAELASSGLAIPPEKMILAGVMAIEFVARERHGARVLLIGSPALGCEARRAGLQLVDKGADLVLLARDEGFTYAKLAHAANEIHRGATLVVSNPDTTHPGASNLLVPETGALMRAILACVQPSAVHIVGKPEPALFQEAMRILGSVPSNSVVVGDNLETDVAGAVRLGMPYLLLGSGPQADAADLMQLSKRLARGEPLLPASRQLLRG